MDPKLRDLLATHDIPCPHCGYNLRALTRPTCPECGGEITLRLVELTITTARSQEQENAIRARWYRTMCVLLMVSLLLSATLVAMGLARFSPGQRRLIIVVLAAGAACAGLLRVWILRMGEKNTRRADRIIEHTQGLVGALTLVALIPLIVGGLHLLVQLMS